MASIHGVNCTMVKRAGTTLKQGVEAWFTPGMGGVGAQNVGKHQGEARFLAVFYGNHISLDPENINDWFAAIEGKQGEIGTIVDDWGTNYANFLILDVGERSKVAAQLPGSNLEAIGNLEIYGVVANHPTA